MMIMMLGLLPLANNSSIDMSLTLFDLREDYMNVAGIPIACDCIVILGFYIGNRITERRTAMPENVPKPLTPGTFTPFGGEFDQLFNRMMRAWSFGFLEPAGNGHMRALGTLEHAPKVEVQENGKTYTVTVELPGVDQKDVKVLVEDGVLTVSGDKHVERTDEKTHYSERSYGSFTRAFTLPSDADRNDISANFSKGVLTLQIAKMTGRPERARQIEVQPA